MASSATAMNALPIPKALAPEPTELKVDGISSLCTPPVAVSDVWAMAVPEINAPSTLRQIRKTDGVTNPVRQMDSGETPAPASDISG